MSPTNSKHPPNPISVPVLDLVRQYETIREEIDAAIREVVQSGRFILGPFVGRFESMAAEYCGAKHAIGVASGTDALLLSLRALEIGPGDRVILPSFTFFATAGVVHNVGATPVFCDIDPATFNIDPEHVRRILAEHRFPTNPKSSTNSESSATHHSPPTRIKAIIPVHLYGQMADMDEIMAIAKEYDLAVIEDAAQAIGAEYWGGSPNELNKPTELNEREPSARRAGSIGDLGCFSFYPTKNLGAYGDGGMITTDDEDLADSLRLLRVHGARPKYFHRMIGINSRLDAIQAAILAVKLEHLDGWSAARAEIADRYDELLTDVEGIVTPYRVSDRSHIFHQYTIRVLGGKRDTLREHMTGQGIGTMIYYPRPLHLQECFAHLGYRKGELPISESASEEVLSLPIFPEIREEEIDAVVRAIRGFFAAA